MENLIRELYFTKSFAVIGGTSNICYNCKFPSSDCLNISGKMIEIKQKITSSDLRVIKWLTGLTVDCDFKEVEFLSDKWKTNLN